jgi:hypothetical protein
LGADGTEASPSILPLPCFKTDTEVYLLIKKTLYSFTPLEVKPVLTLPEKIKCRTSRYSRGTLYYENGAEGIKRSDIGN